MSVLRPISMIALPLLLIACTPAPGEPDVVMIKDPMPPAPDAVPDQEPGDTCGAATYQHFVGQQSPQMNLPAGANYRQYRSGDALTMDFSPGRINFEHDQTGKLIRVSCG